MNQSEPLPWLPFEIKPVDGDWLHHNVPLDHWCVTRDDLKELRKIVKIAVRDGHIKPTERDPFNPEDQRYVTTTGTCTSDRVYLRLKVSVGVRPDGWPSVTVGARTDVRPAERPAGRPAGQSSAAPVSSAAPKHLIEAAPFGRLDQMLRTTV